MLWGRGGPLPAPLVTQADLPPLPDDNENGWTHIQALPADLSVDLSEDAGLALYRAQNEDLPVAERWEALIGASQAFHVPASPTQVEALAAWSRAIQAPTVAPGCNRDQREICRDIVYGKVHRLALAESARLAMDEQWGAAKSKLASAIKADRELLANSRDGIDAMVALSALSEALPLAHLFEHRHRDPSVRLRAELDALAEYGELEDESVKQRIATQSYVSSYKSLRAIEERGAWAWTRDGDWRPGLLYDAEHTASLLESSYLNFDAEPDNALGCDWLAALRNPIGCDYFDPVSSIAAHKTAFASIEHDLETARRWSRRIQDLEAR